MILIVLSLLYEKYNLNYTINVQLGFLTLNK